MYIAVLDYNVGSVKMYDVDGEQMVKELSDMGIDASGMDETELAEEWLSSVKNFAMDSISFMTDNYINVEWQCKEKPLVVGSIDDFENYSVESLTDEQKEGILRDLEKTFCNDHVMECYWDAVDYVAEEYGLVRKEDEEDEEDE